MRAVGTYTYIYIPYIHICTVTALCRCLSCKLGKGKIRRCKGSDHRTSPINPSHGPYMLLYLVICSPAHGYILFIYITLPSIFRWLFVGGPSALLLFFRLSVTLLALSRTKNGPGIAARSQRTTPPTRLLQLIRSDAEHDSSLDEGDSQARGCRELYWVFFLELEICICVWMIYIYVCMYVHIQ